MNKFFYILLIYIFKLSNENNIIKVKTNIKSDSFYLYLNVPSLNIIKQEIRIIFSYPKPIIGYESHQIKNEMMVFASDNIDNRTENNIIEISYNSSSTSTLLIDSPKDFDYLVEPKTTLITYHLSYSDRKMSQNYNRLIIVPQYRKDSYSFLNSLENRKMIYNQKLGILKENLYFGGFSNDIKQKYKDKIVLDIIGNNTWAFLPNSIKLKFGTKYIECPISQNGMYFRSGDESVIYKKTIFFDSLFFKEFFSRTDGGCYIYNNGIRDLVHCPYKYLDRLPEKIIFNLGQYQLIIKKSQYYIDGLPIFDINKSNLFPSFSIPFSLFNEFATEMDIENKRMILYFNQEYFFHSDFLLERIINVNKKLYIICIILVLIIIIFLGSICFFRNKNKLKEKKSENNDKIKELVNFEII